MEQTNIDFKLEVGEQSITIGKNGGFNLINYEGLDSPPIEIMAVENALADGDIFEGSRYGSREITIEADTLNIEDTIVQREKLISMMNAHKKATLHIDYRGIKRKISGHISSFLISSKNIYQPFTFQIMLTCPNPFLLDVETSSRKFSAETNLIHDTWALVKNKSIVATSVGQVDTIAVNNSGHVASGLKITLDFYGEVSTPKITNLSTGEYMEFEVFFIANESLIINTTLGERQAIELPDNFARFFTVGSNYFYVDTGVTYLQCTAKSGQDNMRATIGIVRQYLGV